jgi:hypothetical protein
MSKAQLVFFEVVGDLGIDVEPLTFPWLTNKLKPASEGVEGRLWSLFLKLGGSENGMKTKASRLICPDGYLPARNCLFEFDEVQHFTPQRLTTLEGAKTR